MKNIKQVFTVIASDFTSANTKATEYVNNGLTEAFAAGLNESAYALALSGIDAWPITAAIVAALATDKVIKLNTRKLKKRKDISYNEQRTQNAVMSAIIQGIKVEELPKHVSKHVSNARMNEMIAYARAVFKMNGRGDTGCKTVFDIPPVLLSEMTPEEMRSHLL